MVVVSVALLAPGAAEALLRLRNYEGLVPGTIPARPMEAPKLGPAVGAPAMGLVHVLDAVAALIKLHLKRKTGAGSLVAPLPVQPFEDEHPVRSRAGGAVAGRIAGVGLRGRARAGAGQSAGIEGGAHDVYGQDVVRTAGPA